MSLIWEGRNCTPGILMLLVELLYACRLCTCQMPMSLVRRFGTPTTSDSVPLCLKEATTRFSEENTGEILYMFLVVSFCEPRML